jgi:hypothetical protein
MERCNDTALCVLRVNKWSDVMILCVLSVNRWSDVMILFLCTKVNRWSDVMLFVCVY